MEVILILLMGIALFELAAWHWGVDSVDDINSPEWNRRKHWRVPQQRR